MVYRQDRNVNPVKAIRCNLQCKTCGTTRLRSQTSPTWTT